MNLNNVTLPLGLKKCFYIAPKAIFSRYLQCFLHITHPKGYMQHSTKNSKIELPCRKNAFFLRDCIPADMRKKQFSCNLQCFFLHLSNTDFDPQKSANHPPQRAVFTVILQCFFHISNTQITLPPPMAPYVGRSWGLCWVLLGRLGPMLSQLGTMLGVPGFYVGPSWLCVGLSWGMLRDAAT